MKGNSFKLDQKNDTMLVNIIHQITAGIKNGSLTIVKQDNVVIQMNIHEKISISENYPAAG